MKVGTQQGNHQLETDANTLTDQGCPKDSITFIVSALNPIWLFVS